MSTFVACRSRYRSALSLSALLALTALARAEGAGAPSAQVAVVIDTSGSVGPVQLDRARRLSEALLEALPPGSQVSVFSFDDTARLVVARTDNLLALRNGITALVVRGRHTALHDALYDASRYVSNAPGASRGLVLVTDGRDENSTLNLEDGLRVAETARIPVHAIAVGRADVRVLRRIAKLTGGSYSHLDDARAAVLAGALTEAGRAGTSGAATKGAVAGAPTRAPDTGIAAGSAETSGPADSGTRAAAGSSTQAATGSRTALPWAAGAGLLLVAAAAFVVVSRRRRVMPDCQTCGRELPAVGARCPACSPAARTPPPAPRTFGVRTDDPPTARIPAANPGAASEARMLDADLSPTVLARLNATEEFLEKTVTLRPRPVLSITRGPHAGQVVELSTETSTSLGRARANDLVLNDVSVSSEHCRIRNEDGRFVVHDLKSTNGTFVNERRVTSHALAEGDVIKLGETQLQFRQELKRG